MASAAPDIGDWRFPNRATPLGSAAYYAVRFTPDAQRERNASLIAWHDLIRRIADRPQDPGVARLKLDWWRTEVGRLAAGRAQHPLAVALQGQGVDAAAVTPMLTIIDAAEDLVRAPTPDDARAFAERCRRDLGSLFQLLGRLDRNAPDLAQACREGGAYCAAVEHVRRLPERPERLPVDLAPSRLSQLSRAHRSERLEELLAEFGPPMRQPALPDLARRLMALAGAMHRKLRRAGYPVGDHAVDRPPIAHLWTAWRCR